MAPRLVGTRCLAVIPARGGSKGVPRKNARPLVGRPLIAHTIEQALAARLVDRVAVSTDDPEIAAIARRFGAEVIIRPEELAGDGASSETALLHALDHLGQSEGYQPDLLVMLQCTSPLTRAEDIDGTIRILHEEEAASAFTATPFFHFLWRRYADGQAVAINHSVARRPRRQDMEPQFIETGAVYAMRVPGFLEAKHRFFGRTVFYATPAERTLEIDEPIDFVKAEAILREQRRTRATDLLPARLGAVVFDFDGVMTDDRVLVFEDGREAVFCSRSDGLGLERLKTLGLPILVISKETNKVVAARCRKLAIECVQSANDKLPVLEAWAHVNGLGLEQIVYVGNDINDLACLQAVGCGVAPADARPEAKAAARLLLDADGGEGAVREIADLVAEALDQPRALTAGPRYGT